MGLRKLTEKTKKVSGGFPQRFQWDKKERFIDLVEEVGELANALLIEEKKKPQRVLHPGNSIADALCDLLFDLLLLADLYEVDLEKEYPAMLKRLKERIKSGQFEE